MKVKSDGGGDNYNVTVTEIKRKRRVSKKEGKR